MAQQLVSSTFMIICWCYSFSSYCQDGFIEGKPRIAYWQVGQNKETVIMLHGGPAVPHQYLRPEFDALTQTSRVIYYDQRGCGESDSALSYTWQLHVADLKRLITKISPTKKVFLVGSSWGSILAIMYAHTYQEDVKGLILTGTIGWRGLQEPYHRENYVPTGRDTIIMRERRYVNRLSNTGQTETKIENVSKVVISTSGLPRNEPMDSRVSAPTADQLKQITVPILLFNGTYEQTIDWVEGYKKIFSNLQLMTIEGGGHDCWLSNPTLFFSVSNNFILSVKD